MKLIKTHSLILLSVLIFILCTSSSLYLKTQKKNELEAKVCKHRWGMNVSFTQTTDQYLTNQLAYAAEFYGLKYNIPLTVFEFRDRGQDQYDAYKMGRIDYAVYSNTCDSDVKKSPRSYILNYIDVVTKIREGKRPSTLSYGCGLDFYKDEIRDLFLMGRNSNSSNYTVGFNYYSNEPDSFQDTLHAVFSQISRPSTTRYFQMVKENNDSRLEITKNHIRDTYNTSGFFTDFSHWQEYKHYGIPVDELATHFRNMGEGFSSLDVFRGSYNDIAEYYYVKQAVDKLEVHRSKKKIIVSVTASKKGDYDYALISVPVSIRVDLNENKLSKYDFKSIKGGNIIKMENGDLIFDLNLNFINDTIIVTDTLIVTKNPNYLNFTIPEVFIENNEILSNQEIKITVFKKIINSDDKMISICERNLVPKKKHILSTVRENEYDYFIGYINGTGNSGLTKWE